MYYNHCYYVVLLVKIICYIGIEAEDVSDCSVSQSRIARTVLKEVFYPLFTFSNLPIPSDCVFNSKYDIFELHENLKLRNNDYDWECNLCGKRFYSEKSIDKHFKSRHYLDVYTHNRSVCFASYCNLLRCHVYQPNLEFGNYVFWDEALCKPNQFNKMIQICEQLITDCTSGNTSKHLQLRKWLRHSFCENLSCDRYWKVPDHHVKNSALYKFITTFVMIIGILIYYAVIFMRLSQSVFRLRVSSLSLFTDSAYK